MLTLRKPPFAFLQRSRFQHPPTGNNLTLPQLATKSSSSFLFAHVTQPVNIYYQVDVTILLLKCLILSWGDPWKSLHAITSRYEVSSCNGISISLHMDTVDLDILVGCDGCLAIDVRLRLRCACNNVLNRSSSWFSLNFEVAGL